MTTERMGLRRTHSYLRFRISAWCSWDENPGRSAELYYVLMPEETQVTMMEYCLSNNSKIVLNGPLVATVSLRLKTVTLRFYQDYLDSTGLWLCVRVLVQFYMATGT